MPVLATSLDEPAATLVRRLWVLLEGELGLKGVRKVPFPHLTWMGCEMLDTPRLVDLLGSLGQAQAPVQALSASLGVFLQPAPVIHLAVVSSPAVEALHRRLWNLVEPCAEEMHGLYRPELWVPHITLAQGDLKPEMVPEVMKLLGHIPFPLDFTFKNLTLFQWIGPRFEPIERFPLTGKI